MAKSIPTRILEAARAELGVHEVPPGSNRGPRVQEYQNETWFAGTSGWPWCVAFAWGWVLWKNALNRPNPYRTASVAQLEAWTRKNPKWLGKAPPKAGDLACLDGGSHVTIVEKVARDGLTFTGLGGNQANSVNRTTYATRRITTLVRFPMALHSHDPSLDPKPAPIYEVVRGEGSKARVVFRNKSLNAATDAARRLLARGAKGLRIRRRKG